MKKMLTALLVVFLLGFEIIAGPAPQRVRPVLGTFPVLELRPRTVALGFLIASPEMFFTFTIDPGFFEPSLNCTFAFPLSPQKFWAFGVAFPPRMETHHILTPWAGIGFLPWPNLYGILQVFLSGSFTITIGVIFEFLL